MATGLRRGEIAGLHVSHFDPAGCQVHIVQTYAYLLDETTGRRRWQLKPYPQRRPTRYHRSDRAVRHAKALIGPDQRSSDETPQNS
ncbi:hypothetical protein [Nonomuraea sp. NPDC003709]|uniref:hypothetical protein n=1 Tax=Nonomuraea sp. NPDC003709 TaxID=3154450 RepID=UPI0033AED25C